MKNKINLSKTSLSNWRTMAHFDNGGKYGSTFVECQIVYVKGHFEAYITDGFKYWQYAIFSSLKEAVRWGNKIISA